MRVIGVVTKLALPTGVYARKGIANEEELRTVWEGAAESVKAATSAAASSAMLTATSLAFSAFFDPYTLAKKLLAKPPPLTAIQGAVETEPRSIVIPSRLMGPIYTDFDAPIFHGLFNSEGMLARVMQAEGGNVDLMIVDQASANESFKRAGGGPFGAGLHLPHPKDHSVLIPAKDFDTYLLQEIRAEWVRTFEALGASHVVIAEATRGAGRTSGDKGPVAADMRAAYGRESVEESTYREGTFDPDRARSGRLFLYDYPEIRTIVEGRIHGHQSSWRRTLKVNASFGLDVGVLKLFGANASAAYERTYDLFVEFYPKR